MFVLNQEQTKAVLNCNQNKSIFAPPGTGKSVCVAYLANNILASNRPDLWNQFKKRLDPFILEKHASQMSQMNAEYIKPSQILIVSFMRKAICDLKSKVKQHSSFIPYYQNLSIMSYHSLASKIIKHVEANQLQLCPDNETLKQIEQSISEVEVYDILTKKQIFKNDQSFYKKSIKRLAAQKVKGYMEKSFQRGDIYPQAISKLRQKNEEEYRRCLLICQKIKAFLKFLKENNKITYTQMLRRAYEYLLTNQSARLFFQNKYKYIIVDQFQDASALQYSILQLLSKRAFLAVIGDDDQNIYQFRQAFLGIFSKFHQDRPAHKKYTLNLNYRSTRQIIQLATKFIEPTQTNRKQLNVLQQNRNGHKCRLVQCNSLSQQVEFIFKTIKRLKIENPHMRYKDIVVIFRYKKRYLQMKSIIKQFVTDIPIKFLDFQITDTKQYKDLIAVIYLALNRGNASALKRVLQMQSKTLGKGVSFKNLKTDSNGYRRMIFMLDKIVQLIKENRPKHAVYLIFQLINYRKILTARYTKAKLTDIQSLVQLKIKQLAELFQINQEDAPSQQNQLESERNLNLMKLAIEVNNYDSSEVEDLQEGRVTLCTIHKTKGLQFKVVFMFNIQNPHSQEDFYDQILRRPAQSIVNQNRRVFYVGLSRAREVLYLVYQLRNDREPLFIQEIKRIQNIGQLCIIQENIISAIRDQFDSQEHFGMAFRGIKRQRQEQYTRTVQYPRRAYHYHGHFRPFQR